MQASKNPGIRDIALIALLTLLAVLVQGYHPGVEDAEVYLPGVKQALNPGLYPHNSEFLTAHAGMTLFPRLIAGSVRITHLPLDWVLLLWHLACIFLLLLGCWRLGRLVFSNSLACWGGVALISALLTITVAGTSLHLMDEYLNTRSFSAPAVVFVVLNVVERRFLRATLWCVFTAAIHPLMAVFGAAYAAVLLLLKSQRQPVAGKPGPALATTAALVPFGLLSGASDAYREAIVSRPYFFLLRWEWYEWLGVLAPIPLLWWFRWIGRKQNLPLLERMSTALAIFSLATVIAGLVMTVPPFFMGLVKLQPMRSFHLVYILFFLFVGGLLAQWVLKRHIWRWAVLFVPLAAGIFYAQHQTFPDTPHLELPGTAPRNSWVEAFLWIKSNTPEGAYFALDPDHMSLPGEDQHGFRAIAERSMLADNVKDRGVVTMFPALAETWRKQARATEGWKRFQISDFERLNRTFGVDWVVLVRSAIAGLPIQNAGDGQPGSSGLRCPYRNETLLVCRLN